jgi:hypothetical protein
MRVNFRLSARFATILSVGEGLAVFALSFWIVVTLQILGGAYASGFGGDGDEAPHLVTALMVRDYIAGLDFHHPWQFAQQYYYHYPEVAIGHWPPVLYGALGTWFLVFGASRGTSLVFVAIVAATTASIIYSTGRRLIARWAGILAALLFLCSPLVQESTARVTTEHLVTLAMLVSTLCFARFARTGQIGHGLEFGFVAALAILTRGSGWALGMVPGLTIALTKRWWLLRRSGLWLSAVPVLVATVPWYVFTLGMVEDSWEGGSSYWLKAGVNLSWDIYLALGFIVLFFALIGVWTTIIHVNRRAEVTPEWAALAGLAVATFALHCIIPTGAVSRFMVAVIPSIVLFSAAGVDSIAHRLDARLPIGAIRVGLAVIVIVAFCAERFTLPLPLRNAGYEALVRDVAARVSNRPQIWLISSGPWGEGSLVAAVALGEARPASYILRGKTILAGGDWMWRKQQDRFDTQARLGELLNDLSVSIIVIDDQIQPDFRRPYQDRLRKLVASENDQWELFGSYPQTQGGIVFSNSLHVYARRSVASFGTAAPAIRLDRLRALMVRKELR